jgi:hypothetical protein
MLKVVHGKWLILRETHTHTHTLISIEHHASQPYIYIYILMIKFKNNTVHWFWSGAVIKLSRINILMIIKA